MIRRASCLSWLNWMDFPQRKYVIIKIWLIFSYILRSYDKVKGFMEHFLFLLKLCHYFIHVLIWNFSIGLRAWIAANTEKGHGIQDKYKFESDLVVVHANFVFLSISERWPSPKNKNKTATVTIHNLIETFFFWIVFQRIRNIDEIRQRKNNDTINY